MDAKRTDGRTPLHLSIKTGDAALVQMLLSNGASVNVTNDEGYTALHVASYLGQTSSSRSSSSTGHALMP